MAPTKSPPGLGKELFQAKNMQHNAGVVNFMCAALTGHSGASGQGCPFTCMTVCCERHAAACLVRW